MKRLMTIAVVAIIALGSGCAIRGRLPRDAEFCRSWSVANTGHPNPVLTGPYDGHLRLLNEAETKGSVDSPLLTSENLLAFRSTRERVIVFDLKNGKQIMQIHRRMGILTDPAIIDSFLVLVQTQPLGRIQIVNIHTGAVIREKSLNEIRAGPIIVEKSLIFGTVTGLVSLSFPDLSVKWRYQSKGMVDIAPITDGPAVYYGDASGGFGKISAADGKLLWQQDCHSAAVSGLTSGRYLYGGLADGKLMALDKESGQAVWQYQAEFPIRGGVVEDDGRVYFGGGDGAIVGIDAATGEKQWSYQTGGVISARPLVYGQAVLIGSQDRTFYSLDKQTGFLIASQRLEGAVSESAVVVGGKICVACRKSRIYCFEGMR